MKVIVLSSLTIPLSTMSFQTLSSHSVTYKSLANRIDYGIERPDQVEKYKDIYIKEAESYALPLQVERMEQFFNDAINQKKQG